MLFLYEQFLTKAAEGTILTKPRHPSGKKQKPMGPGVKGETESLQSTKHA